VTLTTKQQVFVDEYLVDLNATQAAVRAGYKLSSAEGHSYRFLANPKIRAKIASRMAERVQRVEVSQDRVLLEIARLAFNDPRRAFAVNGALLPMIAWPDDLAAAVASVKIREVKGEDGEVLGEIKEIRFWDKGKALELAARHLGLLKDRLEVSTPVAELIRAARARIRQA
jgi:phage terminase small subunit